MNEFIRQVISDKNIQGKVFSQEDYYYMLKYYGVKKDTRLYLDIEKYYQDFLHSLGNSLVRYEVRNLGSDENTTHYIAFYADRKADYLEAVKVYFPVKYEYMISALKTVFLYLIRNSIEATVKFHVKATNEGIVIRFYHREDVKPFIDYCNNNFVLDDLLIKPHPFMATIHGFGIVRDDNEVGTYNSTLSGLLQEYFGFLDHNSSYSLASDLDFLDYVSKRANIEENSILKFNIRAIEKNIKMILNHENPL